MAKTICPGRKQRREQEAQGLPLALLGDAPCRKHRADQQIERQHVGDVIGGLVGPQEKQDRHQGDRKHHADLNHDPQHERSLAENLAAELLVEDGIRAVGHQVGALGRRKELVGEEIAIDDHADRVFHLFFLVDDVLAFAADVRRMQQAAVDQNAEDRPGGQAPGRQDRQRDEITGDDVVGARQDDAQRPPAAE